MSRVQELVLVEAPVADVWALVGDPRRYPEWLPLVVEIQGERFEEGAEFVQVSSKPMKDAHFLIDHRDELHEIRMHCTVSGMFVHWQLTGAQGGTFVSVESGMDPVRTRDRVIDASFGRRFFRRWLSEAVDSLRQAVSPPASR